MIHTLFYVVIRTCKMLIKIKISKLFLDSGIFVQNYQKIYLPSNTRQNESNWKNTFVWKRNKRPLLKCIVYWFLVKKLTGNHCPNVIFVFCTYENYTFYMFNYALHVYS